MQLLREGYPHLQHRVLREEKQYGYISGTDSVMTVGVIIRTFITATIIILFIYFVLFNKTLNSEVCLSGRS